MSPSKLDVPVGIRVIQKVFPNTSILDRNSRAWKSYILVLTFVIYTCYHASRKPLSVVKSVLNQNCSTVTPPPGTNTSDHCWCCWAPFDIDQPNFLFGLLDSTFLFAYAVSMFFSGFIAERMNLRYFLFIGTLMSGVFAYQLGLAKVYEIHQLPYFLVVQLLGGIFQSAGWPGVVTVMGNWFGENKTGFIFGIWNSHTSVGNILGALIAGEFVQTNWALSFTILGLIMIVLSVIIFIFLVSEPTPINNCAKTRSSDTDDQSDATTSQETEDKARVEQRPILCAGQSNDAKAIGFVEALLIPGVFEFSLCLFFAKLVSYTFLYWLPFYINASTTFDAKVSAYLSTLFDIGGILGGIFAGAISDYTGMQAFTCGAMLVYSIPMLYIYYIYGSSCLGVCIALLLLTGALVNGPYALITTVVSAKLGLEPSLVENTRALSTVTAIIDGTGSMGAAVGPLLAGFVSGHMGWDFVFYMLMVSDVLALCMLLRLMKNELQIFSRTRSHGWTS